MSEIKFYSHKGGEWRAAIGTKLYRVRRVGEGFVAQRQGSGIGSERGWITLAECAERADAEQAIRDLMAQKPEPVIEALPPVVAEKLAPVLAPKKAKAAKPKAFKKGSAAGAAASEPKLHPDLKIVDGKRVWRNSGPEYNRKRRERNAAKKAAALAAASTPTPKGA